MLSTSRAVKSGMYQDAKYSNLELSDAALRARMRKVYVSVAKARRVHHRLGSGDGQKLHAARVFHCCIYLCAFHVHCLTLFVLFAGKSTCSGCACALSLTVGCWVVQGSSGSWTSGAGSN